MIIKRKGKAGRVEVSVDVEQGKGVFIYIREKVDPVGGRYQDIQTVCLTVEELVKVYGYVAQNLPESFR